MASQILFTLGVLDIPSPHSFELIFPFAEAALCASYSFVWLLAFLQNLHPVDGHISQAAVIFMLASWGTLSLVRTSPLEKGASPELSTSCSFHASA